MFSLQTLDRASIPQGRANLGPISTIAATARNEPCFSRPLHGRGRFRSLGRILIIDHGTIVARRHQPTQARFGRCDHADAAQRRDAARADHCRRAEWAPNTPTSEANVVRFHVPDGGHALPALIGALTRQGSMPSALTSTARRSTTSLTLTGRNLRD